MTPSTRRRHAATTACATTLLLVITITAATAGPAFAAAPPAADSSAAPPATATDRQGRVEAYLAANPGGVQISSTDIAYGDGAFIVSVTPPDATPPDATPTDATPTDATPLASPDCPSGWYCFYDGINFTYPRGRLSDCGLQDLAEWGWRNRTESAHYNLSTGSVTFINDGTTDTALFTISTSRRTIADVSPNRNRADFAYRSC